MLKSLYSSGDFAKDNRFMQDSKKALLSQIDKRKHIDHERAVDRLEDRSEA